MKPIPVQNWKLRGLVFIPGHAYGCRYPSLLFSVTGSALTASRLVELGNRISKTTALEKFEIRPLPAGNSEADWLRSITWLLDTVQQIQRAAGLPVYEDGRIIALGRDWAKCLTPTLQSSFDPVTKILHALLSLFSLRESDQIDRQVAQLARTVDMLEKFQPQASNTPRFIRAALQRGIPVQEFPGQVFQYGMGCRSRWLASTFTDETPQISSLLSKNKQAAAEVLRRAGIPVPQHRAVISVDAAIATARKLGYPVVVKPADLDAGIGVSAGLVTDEDVKAAFLKAKRHSQHILVEKHVDGKDYRLIVFHGELVWAIERVPGGVVGDGKSSVRQLVAQLNADPRRGDSRHSVLKRLILNREAKTLLRRAGLTADSIPGAGQFVRLRRIANIAAGGTPVAVTDRVHPDNRRLAVRAAEILRLDIAGVDFLMPDISRSWQEVGAYICEVNSQPTLGQATASHLYGEILGKLVGGNGRIPTVVVFGAPPELQLASRLEAGLGEKGWTVGCHDNDGVRIGGCPVILGKIRPLQAGWSLLADRKVSAVVLSVNDDSLLITGLPFARYDLLLIAGTSVFLTAEKSQCKSVFHELLMTLLPACDGEVIVLANSGLEIGGYERWTPAKWHPQPIEQERAMNFLVRRIPELAQRHSQGK